MKKACPWILQLMLLAALRSECQSLRRPVAAVYTGLGAYSLRHVDVFSLTANQASLAQVKNRSAGVYGERRFMLRELSFYTAVFALPTASGNFGLKTLYAGFSDFNESQIGLAYGRKLGSKADIGVAFDYLGIRMAGYGNAPYFGFELGLMLHLTEKLHSGMHLNNPVSGKSGKTLTDGLPGEKRSAVFAFGLGYDASEKFLFSAEIEKEEEHPVNVNAGVQYRIQSQLLARVGLSTATSSAWFGVGITLRSFRLDVTAAYHPQLGFTPGLLLLFNLARKPV